MRYRSAHAATSGSVPFMLRGPRPLRLALSATVAAAIGLTPALTISSPAAAITPMSSGGVTVSNATVTEGGDLTFTVKCLAGEDCASGSNIYNLTIVDDSTSSSDYTGASPVSVTFTAAASKTVTVHTVDDGVYEGTEKLNLVATLSTDSNVTTADPGSGLGTIYDKQTIPSYTLKVAPSPVGETAGTATITATLSGKSSFLTSIALNTADETALAGSDYTALNNAPLTINAGVLTGTATVTITDDTVKDTADLETFTVNGTADNASPKGQSVTVTIKDNEPTPKVHLSVAPNSVAEGNDLTYTVTTDTMSELPISVKWNAADVTVPAGDDKATPVDDFSYPSTRSVMIPVGDNTADFIVTAVADSLNENDEDFGVEISDPTNAVLGSPVKVAAKITDGDANLTPVVTVDPTSVTEGNAGKVRKTFTAKIDPKSGRTATVKWTTTDGSAIKGKDYVANSGTLVFPVGTTTQTFTVDIIGDLINEGDETFDITLSNVSGDMSVDVSNPTIPITITDDDAKPTVTFDNVSIKEGDAGSALVLPLKLSNPSGWDITYDLTDATAMNSGTADDGAITTPGTGDYKLLSGSLTIPAGQTTGYAVILVNGDVVYEPTETAFVTATVNTMSNSDQYVASSASPKTAKITLENDDKAPALEVDSVSGKEGTSVSLTGTVRGVSSTDTTVNVMFKGYTMGGKKAADEKDFTNPGIVPVLIQAGTDNGSTLSITKVALLEDNSAEPAETILVNGTGVGNVGSVIDGVITIEGNDGSGPSVPGKPTISAPDKVMGAVAVKITGKTTASTKVELWGAPVSGGELKYITMATSDKNGWYSFSRWIGVGYKFATQAGGKNSDTVTVWVQQMPLFVAKGGKGMVSLAVQGNPRAPGQTVIVQRWTTGGWVNSWRGTTGADNLWKASPAVAKGTWTLRAFVAGSTPNGLLPGYTDSVKVTVS